jgi:hypothetical protein
LSESEGVTVTVVLATWLQPASLPTVTLYTPAILVLIAPVVAPVDHW